MTITVRGIPQEIADEVRRTRRAPGYGHPAHHEIASGTGPCRCCLRPFVVGAEGRLLFTYRPIGDASSLMAPGPIFIHADHCESHSGPGFPPGLRALPLAIEARASDSRVIALEALGDTRAETAIDRMFDHDEADWLHLRHAEAGCFVARVDRG